MSELKTASSEERARMDAVIEAVGRVIGGPLSLRFPVSRVLEALCVVAGMGVGLSVRTAEDLMVHVELGQKAAAERKEFPAPVPFVRDVPRQVEGLVKALVLSTAATAFRHSGANEPIDTLEADSALGHLVGQISTLVRIERAELLALLQVGVDKAQPMVAETQAAMARYRDAKAKREQERS